MEIKIIYSKRFENSLIKIKSYLNSTKPYLWSSTSIYIEEKIDSILNNPYIGKEGSIMGTRELIFPKLPYYIVYKIIEINNELVLLNIFHTSRKYP